MKKITYFFLIVILLASCTKEYIEKPTCFYYMELSDKFTGDLKPIRVDTIWTSGVPGVLNYACGTDIDKMEQTNKNPYLEGCESGWQIIHYKIFY
jgi:hypothetical protein